MRHGETDANAARILQRPEVPLSPRGLAQAGRLACRLAGEPIAGILASDLVRARMTAERVRDATGAPLRLDALLQERNFGELRGTAYADLGQDPFAPGYAPPGGESWEVFHARVDRAWLCIREAAEAAGGTLVVVTHGLVCRALLVRHSELAERTPVRFDNASLTRIDPQPPHRVDLVNCIRHLDAGAGAPGPGRSAEA